MKFLSQKTIQPPTVSEQGSSSVSIELLVMEFGAEKKETERAARREA